MRKASDLIRKQEPVKINQGLLKQTTPDRVHGCFSSRNSARI